MRYTTPYRHELLPNPLFDRERSQLPRRLNADPHLRRHTLLIYALTWLIGLAIWGISWLHWSTNEIYQPGSMYGYYPMGWNTNMIAFIAFISLVLNFVMDFSSAVTSTGLINSEITGGRWDLLRLTLLDSEQITRTKYAIAQLRVWRITNFTIALRGLVLILMLLTFTAVPASNWSFYGFIDYILHNLVESLLTGLIIIIVAGTYLIEPYWHMKAITAGGLLVSTYTQRLSFSLLGGLAVSAIMLISQIVLISAFGYALSHLLSWLPYNMSAIASTFVALSIFLAIAGAIFLYYHTVQRRLLKRVLRRVNQQD